MVFGFKKCSNSWTFHFRVKLINENNIKLKSYHGAYGRGKNLKGKLWMVSCSVGDD